MTSDSAEKLLRRIEVKRLYEKPGDVLPPPEIEETSALFMRLSLQTGDWRFLNAALKLNDALRSEGRLPGELERLEADAIAQLRKSCGLPERPASKP